MREVLKEIQVDYRIDIIRQVAEKSFIEIGYKKTTMELIAKNAGISKPIVYRYYQNKEDLYFDILTHYYTAKLNELEEAFSTLATDEENLFIFINNLYTLFNENSIFHQSIIEKEGLFLQWFTGGQGVLSLNKSEDLLKKIASVKVKSEKDGIHHCLVLLIMALVGSITMKQELINKNLFSEINEQDALTALKNMARCLLNG